MKTITELKPQVKNQKRVSVYLDGAYYCGLDLLTALKYRLKVGMQISEDKLQEIQLEAEKQSAFDSALKFISRSTKTEKQVKDKLEKLGYLDNVVTKTLEKLKEYSFINDNDYAERYVSTYKGQKGAKLLRLELIKKGVKESVINAVLEDLGEQDETAEKLAEKYMKNKENNLKNSVKCFKYLVSKGFDFDVSKQIAERYKED